MYIMNILIYFESSIWNNLLNIFRCNVFSGSSMASQDLELLREDVHRAVLSEDPNAPQLLQMLLQLPTFRGDVRCDVRDTVTGGLSGGVASGRYPLDRYIDMIDIYIYIYI